MTEIGEIVAVIAGKDTNDDGECWLCSQKQSDEEHKQNLVADPPHKKDLDNSSGELIKALKKAGKPRPEWSVTMEKNDTGTYKVSPGAHHCIPGNESLKQYKVLYEHIKNNGLAYNVNHANNGVWLPGGYGKKVAWGTRTENDFKYEFASLASAIETRHFHGFRHKAYSDRVVKTLESLWQKVQSDDNTCMLCGEDIDESKARPSHGVAARLDAVSALYRALLCSLPEDPDMAKRLVDNDIYTSNETKRLLESRSKKAT